MSTITLPALKTGYTVRPCTIEDVEAVVGLMNACSMATIGEADETVQDRLAEWQTPGFEQAANQRVVLTADDRIVGWGEVNPSDVVILHLDIYVHPEYEDEEIGAYLFAWAEERAREYIAAAPDDARVALRVYTYSQDVDVWYSALLRAAGMQIIRHFWHMEMDLDAPPPSPSWSDGITLKVFDAADDKRPVFEVRRETFQDQFGNVDRPIEEHYAEWLHFWESEGNFVPGMWLMAMDGERIAGIILCRPSHNGEEDRGWVPTLGVRREYRRRGIGEALLYSAFKIFYEQGKKRVGLGVDASSLTGAATLYKRVGMHIAKQFDLYDKELRPGIDTTTHG